MARKLRVEFEGAIYHVTVRANGKGALFADDRDCRWRAVTAQMLCRYGGLTQREAAKTLGMRSGD